MAEKSFRQIEAEIAEKGFAALCNEAALEIQNITRMLGYLLGENPEVKKEVDAICAELMRGGIALAELAKKVD